MGVTVSPIDQAIIARLPGTIKAIDALIPIYLLVDEEEDRIERFVIRKKSNPTFHRNTNTWEFGVDLPDFGMYSMCEVDTVIFVRLDTREVYSIRMCDIPQYGRIWQGLYTADDMIFIPLTHMQPLPGTLDERVV
jgi:hypothetical protein